MDYKKGDNRMKTMYFSDYGILEWLDTEQYFAEPWQYLRSADGADEEFYDIVIHRDSCELRYTKI